MHVIRNKRNKQCTKCVDSVQTAKAVPDLCSHHHHGISDPWPDPCMKLDRHVPQSQHIQVRKQSLPMSTTSLGCDVVKQRIHRSRRFGSKPATSSPMFFFWGGSDWHPQTNKLYNNHHMLPHLRKQKLSHLRSVLPLPVILEPINLPFKMFKYILYIAIHCYTVWICVLLSCYTARTCQVPWASPAGIHLRFQPPKAHWVRLCMPE